MNRLSKKRTSNKNHKRRNSQKSRNSPISRNSQKITIKNSAIVLVSNLGAYSRFIILRDRNSKKWMIPGGNMERGETPFQGMKREFYEEVGQDLPILEKQLKFDFPRYKTRVYIGLSNSKINFIENDEVDAIHFALVDDLITGRLFDKFEFKSYVKSTLNTLKHDIMSI